MAYLSHFEERGVNIQWYFQTRYPQRRLLRSRASKFLRVMDVLKERFADMLASGVARRDEDWDYIARPVFDQLLNPDVHDELSL